MSDLVINVDTNLPPESRKSSEGSRKHQRFLKCRRFLERKGFLKQKQLPAQAPFPKRDGARGCARMDQERGKKRQKVERQGGPARHGGAGKERHPLQAGSSAHRPRAVPKENTKCGAKEPGSCACPPTTSRAGGVSARVNGAQMRRGAVEIRKGSLLSEYESGLPSSPDPTKPSKVVAIDCEMVGTGPGGRNSDLARCSIVSYYGDVMYDKYVRPASPITNYRTRWSGIRKHHMTNAVPFKAAQKEILKILSGKIVVGHAIHNDFKALKYFHPKPLTRDTSKIPLLNRKAGFPENELASLKRLTKQLLHRDIQVGKSGHSSVEDAQATMELYKVIEAEWERHLAASPAE